MQIPPNFSLIDLNTMRQNPENVRDLNFLKVMHVGLAKGDCIYIPAFYWYQIRTETLPTPKPDATEEERKAFEEGLRDLDVSVDFWYEVSSIFMKEIMFGVEK